VACREAGFEMLTLEFETRWATAKPKTQTPRTPSIKPRLIPQSLLFDIGS